MDDDMRTLPSSGPVNTTTRGSFRVQEGLNLYVSQIPPNYNSTRLRDAFVKFGPIHSAKVMHDSQTNESRCFGFVLFEKAADGERAMAEMNGVMLDEGGGRLHVRVARPSALPQPLREDSNINPQAIDNDGGSVGASSRRLSSPVAALQPPQSPHPPTPSTLHSSTVQQTTSGSIQQPIAGARGAPPPPPATALQHPSAAGGAAGFGAPAYCYMQPSFAMGAPMGMPYTVAAMGHQQVFHPGSMGMGMMPQMVPAAGFMPQPLAGGGGVNASGQPMFYMPTTTATGQSMYAPQLASQQMMVGGGAQQQPMFMAQAQPGAASGMVMQPFYAPAYPYQQQWQQ